MGNRFSTEQELSSDNQIDYPLVGRDNERNHVLHLLKTKRVVVLCGTWRSGKSRLARRVGETLVQQYEQCYLLELDPDLTEKQVRDEIRLEMKIFVDITVDLFTDLVGNEVWRSINKKGKCYLFVDSVDVLMTNEIKDSFLNFANAALKKCKDVVWVLVASDKPRFAIASYEEYFVPPMSTDEIVELIYNVTNGMFKECDHQKKKYIKCIAKLCEGSPHGAIMTGVCICLVFCTTLFYFIESNRGL